MRPGNETIFQEFRTGSDTIAVGCPCLDNSPQHKYTVDFRPKSFYFSFGLVMTTQQ